jgi:hypothetical protein
MEDRESRIEAFEKLHRDTGFQPVAASSKFEIEAFKQF